MQDINKSPRQQTKTSEIYKGRKSMNASVKSIKSGASKGTATGKIAALGESEIGSAEVTLNPKASVPQLESEAQQQPEQMAEQQDE
jgi:hypothetical protein